MVTTTPPTQPPAAAVPAAPAQPPPLDLHTALFLDHITDTARTNNDIRRTVRMAVRTIRGMLSGRIPIDHDILQVAKLALRFRPLPMPRPLAPRAPRGPRTSTPPAAPLPPRPSTPSTPPLSTSPAANPGLTRPPAPTQPPEPAAATSTPSPAPAQTPTPTPAAASSLEPESNSEAESTAPLTRDQILARIAEVEAIDAQLDALDIEAASLRRRADEAPTEADRRAHLQSRLDLETLRCRPLLDQATAILSSIPIADLQAASYAVPTPL